MTRRVLAIALLALPILLSAEWALAYRVITTGGRTLDASRLAEVGKVWRLGTPTGPLELPEGAIDFYATFRANTEAGNVVAFRPGGLLRFEAVSFSKGRLTLELAEGRSITVPEAVIDFRASVLEGSLISLPAGRAGGVSVAKASERLPPRREDPPEPEELPVEVEAPPAEEEKEDRSR